jgi:hypothetical protein
MGRGANSARTERIRETRSGGIDAAAELADLTNRIEIDLDRYRALVSKELDQAHEYLGSEIADELGRLEYMRAIAAARRSQNLLIKLQDRLTGRIRELQKVDENLAYDLAAFER